MSAHAALSRVNLLSELQAVAELNHGLFMRLAPHLRAQGGLVFQVTGPDGVAVQVVVRVREQGPYTTLVDVGETRVGTEPWLRPLALTVRLCHDARVAEVVSIAGRSRLQARYPYPNPEMLQQDEKLQVNRLLGDWLAHCLRWGHASDQLPCPV